MELIDTHCHLYDEQFDADRDEVVARATEAGIETIIMPAIEISSYDSMMACAARYAGFALPCIGLHPTSVGPSWEEEMAFVEGHAREKGFVAIGEIGLDGYWSRDYMAEQKRVFAAQLDMAAQGGLPAIIHLRDATEELFEVLEEVRGLPLKGVFHAFSGSYETYRRILGYGDFKFGIGGVITFKKAGIAETVAKMSPSDLILETDAPWLSPAPHRGRRNEPAYTAITAARLAEATNLTAEGIAAITTANAKALFGLGNHNPTP